MARGHVNIRAIGSYLRADDWMRERPTQSPSLDPRFRGGDGGRAENDRKEGTNGSYATPSSTFFMRQFQDAIALTSTAIQMRLLWRVMPLGFVGPELAASLDEPPRCAYSFCSLNFTGEI